MTQLSPPNNKCAKGRWKDVAVNILLSVFSILFFVGSLEGLARLSYTPETITYEGKFEYDKDRKYRLKSNLTNARSGEKLVQTNSSGHRSPEIAVEKPENTVRILVLGDSIAFGHKVLLEEAFPAILEMMLQSFMPDKRIEIINTAVPGYAPFQQYSELKNNLRFDPDLILLQFTLNDVVEPYWLLKKFGGEGKDYHNVEDLVYIDFLLTQHSALYLYLKDIHARIRFGDPSGQNIVKKATQHEKFNVRKLVFEPNDVHIVQAWEEYFKWMDKIVELSAERKIPLVLFVSPYEFQFSLPESQHIPQKKLQVFAEQNDVYFVDVLHRLQEQYTTQIGPNFDQKLLNAFWSDLFMDGDHYTPKGHSWAAALLFPVMKEVLQLKL